MIKIKNISTIAIATTLSLTLPLSESLQAQETIPTQPQLEIDGTNVDDVPNDPEQQRTWRCQQGDKAIAVEAKDITIWQTLVEKEGWKCDEELPVLSGNEHQFNCEPDDTIGILTVTWLKGKGGKAQMANWVNQLSNNNLTCTVDETNSYWE